MLQPPRLRDPGWPERLAEYRADVAVVVAFGQILPQGGARRARARVDQRPRLAPPALPRRRAHRVGHHPRRDARPGSRPSRWTRAWTPGHPARASRPRSAPRRPAGELSARLAGLGADVLLRDPRRLDTLPRIPQDPARRPGAAAQEGGRRLGCELAEPGALTLAGRRVRGAVNPVARAPARRRRAGRLGMWRARAVAGRGRGPGVGPRLGRRLGDRQPAQGLLAASRSAGEPHGRCTGTTSSAARASAGRPLERAAP